MRIVDVCAFYTPAGGGVKTYVERKLAAARPGVEEVIIVAPGRDNAVIQRANGGQIETIAAPHFPLDRRYHYFSDACALHALLDRLEPDVIEVSSPWASPVMVARWPGKAVRSLIMHADPLSAYAYRWFGNFLSHDTIDRRFDRFWRHLRRLDDQFDQVVCASQKLANRLEAGGLRKIITNPMGVEPGIFSPDLRDPILRARLLERCGLGESATLLIALGRHASEKRWPMVIEAVKAAGYDHPVGLVLFGDGRDKKRVLRAAGNNPHIHLAAPISDRRTLATIMASADALIHGCEAETFCMVAAEARASGLPLIIPDDGGAGDQYVPGQGAIYDAGNAAALVEALKQFLQSDPPAQRARASLAAGFTRTMDAHFTELFDRYRTISEKWADAA
ncbi:putative glycosyltransferase [Caenibius tardaugens NBRC 16725]|uniref:Putative glycosyltransferase n=1 Tax=Caenibius tardaugens NBRC 16725 TaxID=1219035 RepID=U2YLK1_9SPHN|nr:glycosyltransferase [Caenibius tardaugens]AZI36624.1 glycosyltransferase [Caenibius tardaugens NBRC 16725]GAD49277.1 putative glycosyltransferase [Caenibius tardaugens NBRC 16725]